MAMPNLRTWVLLMALIRTALLIVGGLTAVMLVLAFTRMPFDAHRWLGTAGGLCNGIPDAVIVLGGSGMPSGPELMRCDLAADLAHSYNGVQVVLLLPQDTGLAAAMQQELVTKGVAPEKIVAVLNGRNTREQALDLLADNSAWVDRNITLVTAPENMYRSLLTFRKAGFMHVCGSPAFDHALFDDLRYAHGGIGGKAYVPDVSNNMDLRYDFWNRLKLEITCIREYTALAYYKLNGWI